MKKFKCPICGKCKSEKTSDGAIVCKNLKCLSVTPPQNKKRKPTLWEYIIWAFLGVCLGYYFTKLII